MRSALTQASSVRRGLIAQLPSQGRCSATFLQRSQKRSSATTHTAYVRRAYASQASSSSTADRLQWKQGAEIRMLYDGDCPLCMREVNMLRRRDAEHGKIDFVDICAPEYAPETNADISYEQAMGEIHAILPSGAVVKNIDVFRRLYEAVGLGWVYAITKVKPIGRAADWVYGIWAKYRLPVTGRPDLQTVLAEKKSCKVR